MQIEYLTTKSRREVSEVTGNALIARKIARRVYTAAPTEPEPEDISPRTGKAKRQYRRRDMQAEK